VTTNPVRKERQGLVLEAGLLVLVLEAVPLAVEKVLLRVRVLVLVPEVFVRVVPLVLVPEVFVRVVPLVLVPEVFVRVVPLVLVPEVFVQALPLVLKALPSVGLQLEAQGIETDKPGCRLSQGQSVAG
jgi:hypothetical protein